MQMSLYHISGLNQDIEELFLVLSFHKSGSTPLDSFNIMTMLLSIWAPYAAGILQTRADERGVRLTFNAFWARIKDYV